MPCRFQHEDVAAVPRGYRVRTVKRGEHEIRVAFPPGRRRKGAGRVVSILHPLGENPSCPIRNIAAQLANPDPCKCGSGEPAVFGGMCARCARVKAKEARERAAKIRAAAFNGKKNPVARVSTYRLETPSGRPIRKATKVVFEDGREVKFLERLPKKRAIREALAQLGKNPGKGASSVYSMAVSLGYPYLRGEGRTAQDGRTWLSRVTKKSDGTGPALFVGWDQQTRKWVIEKENPASKVRRRRNPDDELDQAAELYREFHGREPHEILEFQESELARKEYTALGDAIVLRFVLPDERMLVITFTESDKVLVVSSPNGRQLYLLGGNQDIAGALGEYKVDTSKDLIDLGDAVFISYDASKWQTDFKSTIWEHKLGEESGIHPRGFFDKFKRRIFFAGGNYRVERPGIID